jgi:hypothetical protein
MPERAPAAKTPKPRPPVERTSTREPAAKEEPDSAGARPDRRRAARRPWLSARPSGPRDPGPRRGRSKWAARLRAAFPWLVVGFAILALLLVIASYPIDRHLRGVLEAKMNANLQGYKVSLGSAHLRPLSLALSLNRLVIRQEANPEPPVAIIPHLGTSVEWSQLLTGHLVADALFMRPQLHIDLPQLEAEAAGNVPFKQRGWQQAFQSIYPLKFNRVTVVDGAMTYVDTDPAHPLEVTRFQLEAQNIRNIQSREGVYPSPLHVQAILFGSGRAAVDGSADFLAQPFAGVQGRYVLSEVPIDRFRPIVARANLSLQGGILSSRGEFEHAPRVYQLHVVDLTIRQAHADYIHGSQTAAAESRRGAKVARGARQLSSEPAIVFRVDSLHLADSDVGLVNRDKHYRMYVDRADLAITNLSNQPQQGPAKVRLRGRFMGGGTGRADAHFLETKSGPDLDLSLAVENTPLTAMNEVLRPYLDFTAEGGSFSLYTQLRISHGRIEGYIKALFKDLEVHVDEKGGLGHKIYNRLVQAASKVLENRKSDEVATEATISGKADSPNTSVWQILTNLVRNAFVKTLLPGFEKQVHHKR